MPINNFKLYFNQKKKGGITQKIASSKAYLLININNVNNI